ncbi:MAG: tetratricopeptide repeat protein, partial [Alphaproteobacteria bacterium]|nr:tetratricopeptide repeat protein [Alphaproteobacteria bacterium]
MPANFLLVALLVVGAVGVSLGLVPDARELAFMQYRAQNIEEAEKQLSAQVEAGVLDAAVVNPLIDVYVNVGKVDAAIRLLETYTASAPDDVSALGKLASLFRFAQRTGHFLAAFEALTESAPTRERLRDLIDLYQFHGRYVAQERVLARYVALGFGQPDDYEELALLQAALNDFDGALRTMVAMESRFARRVNDDVATLHVALLLDRGDVRGAIERARRYIRDVRDPHGAAAVAGLMQARGLGPQAYDLLQPIAALAETSETLTAVLIDLEIETGRREAALRRLATLDRTGKLPDNRGATLIDLTLAAGRVDQAFELTQRFDPELLPDWLLIGLIESAIQSDRILLATDLTTRLGDDFLATKPTLAAGLALRQGRRDLAERWIQVAANDPRLPLDEQLELARLFARTDRVERAIALMTKLAEEPATPLATIGDLALLYIERDRAAEGLTLFRRLRRERASPSLDAGWARLEAKVGDARTVLAWLSTARQPDSQLLVDLFHIASDRKQLDLALLAAELDFRRSASNAARRRFAEGLIAAGQPREALLHLRQLLPGDTELRRLYAEALSKAGQADELAKLWLSELESLPDDDPQTAELIYALIDLKQDAAILPRLERLARLDGSRWFHVYVDAAKRAGAIDALVDFIAAELARTDLEPAELEARYFVLHEAEPERAFEILGRLAQSDPDRWSARYIEALRERDRGGDVVALLIERLGRPDLNQARREETIYALIEAGQHAVVLPHLAELARRDGAKWFFAYVDAAKAADAEEQLLGFIEAELDRKDLPPAERETRMFVLTEIAPERALTMLGRLAESDPDRWFAAFVEALRAQGRNEEVTRLLLARIERPDLPEAQRREAVFALIEAGQHMAVLPHLERLAANQGGDWVFAYGKSALAAGRSDVFLAFVRRGLEAPAATDAARQTLVYAALEIIGARPVLPLVREFALGGAASWFDVYADLATKADAGEELAALAEALLERVRPGAAEFDVRLDRLVTLSPTRALALLDRESRRDPARWVEPHLAVLDRLRRRADMPAVLRRALDRPGIPKAERDRR